MFTILHINLLFIFGVSAGVLNNNVDHCNLPTELIREIQSYQPIVNKIINEVTRGEFRGTTFNRLEQFIDTFGNRMAGSKNLENAIDYMLNKSVELNLENVHGEELTIPYWVRGKESAELIEPRQQSIAILSLGDSISTPSEGLVAEVFVVDTFEELKQRSSKVKGKIVVFNEKYLGYPKSVQYRSHGAARAAKFGAVAVLIRSVTPFSLYTPHTGWQDYEDNIPKIPTACITAEDAHMLKRMQNKGEKIVIKINIDTKVIPNRITRNTITEIVGKEKPEKVVIVSGHLDSWDVGQGAMDDGAGALLGWNSLVILKALNLRPRRTLRSILWTAEEIGLRGADAYMKKHKNDLQNFDFVMESDEGTFTPLGIEYAGPQYGACVLKEVVSLLESINATQMQWSTGVGSDIILMTNSGLPGGSLLNKNEKYFWFHHSEADRMDVEDADTLDKCTAVWASVAYIMADLSVTIPKNLTMQLV